MVVFTVFYACLGVPRLFGHSVSPELVKPVLSVLAFVLLFGGAVLVLARSEGREGVGRLLRRLLRWRVGLAWTLLVGAALPGAHPGRLGGDRYLATSTGGMGAHDHPLLPERSRRGGVLLTSLWEEAAWSGLVQTRLMSRRGLVRGSLLTAVPFVLAHVPGAFQNAAPAAAVVNLVAIIVLAPFLRLIAGTLLSRTSGSILAVAVLHASFNASGDLSAAVGGWQFLVALLLLAGLLAVRAGVVALARRRVRRPTPRTS